MSINAQWRFSYFGSNAGAGTEAVSFNDLAWAQVDLPHTWNAFDGQDGGSNYARGFGWYRKHYTVAAEHSGKRVYLFFESVGQKAHVYWNGTLVGNHLGGYAAFCYDVTDKVQFGGDNVIAVRADNAGTSSANPLNIIPRSGDFNKVGGICRNVHVIITNPVHITLLDYASPGVYLTATNVSALSADLEIKTLVRNAGTTTKSATVGAKIYEAAGTLVDTLESTQIVAAESTLPVIQNTVISNPHLWHGRVDPYLYKVIVEVEVDGAVTDIVEQPLGFRYFSVDASNGFVLNGQYLDLHGVAMHEDRRDKSRAISDADREQDMALMAQMGCNWIRPSHYQHAEKFYDLADEYGIVLSTEIPVVDGIDTGSADFANNCRDQLRELIRQNYNHPSVFFWLLYNELTTGGSEVLIGELNTLAHQEDPTRLTACAHNNTSDTAAWSYVTDLLGYNRYMGWYGSSPEGFAAWADSIHAMRQADEIGIMEYGAGANTSQHETPPAYPGPTSPWHPEEYQTYYHEVYWKAMKARPWLWCKTIWNGFDFAVDSRNEGSQPGLNDKGMVTRDRMIKKDAFYWYKANWTTDPMVYITGRRFTPQQTCPPYIKIYSNCERVELFINGSSLGMQTASDCIFQWNSGTVLRPGTNTIRAVGTLGAVTCEDTCSWQLVVAGDPNDCAYMRSLGCGYASDFSGPSGQPDCLVNNLDFAQIAAQWLDNYIETISPVDPGSGNLVAYWPMDGNYNDTTGNHPAVAAPGSGTLSFVSPSQKGQAVLFDGASGLNCAASSGINLTNGGTISAWIKSSGETDPYACVMAKGVYAWRLIRNNEGTTVSFHFNPADGTTEFQANGVTSVLDGQWHHLMGVYDGSAICLYVDGQLDASAEVTKALRTSADAVYIGSRVGRLSDRSWNGQIDEVRIYDRALSAGERLYLSEGDAYTQIPDPPRATDLVMDGLIDMNDLLVFIDWWMQDQQVNN